MVMPATRTDWTVDMLDALEDDGQRYELIDGALFVTPSPTDIHQLVVFEIAHRLHNYLSGARFGRVVTAPIDVRCGDRTRNRVQPDVLVLRLHDGNRPTYPYELRDLTLIIEVSSPGSVRLDFQIKRELYLREGVCEYWIADPLARNVTRWRTGGESGELLADDISWMMPGMATPMTLVLSQLFADTLD
jgi:Uma2 family endonuclease